ncbi:hypothetical protein DFJ73DRAFT_919983 [Zopfochytrium polystomum]|nr:hypothetical protein DFJ73DRAFT_919983 [Zopfochytrium polystomum]
MLVLRFSLAVLAAVTLAGSATAAPIGGSNEDSSSHASPIRAPRQLSASSVSAAPSFVLGLFRRVDPISATIYGTAAGISAVGAGKAFVEGHHRQRKVAQKATQENYKKKFEEDKDKETKRVNHFAEDPSQSCYSTDCSKKKKFKPDSVSSLRRAFDSLFEEEEWAESDLDEDGAVDDFVADASTDVDSLVQDAIKNNPLSSKNPLTPYQKKPLSRTNSAPSKLSSGSAKAEKVPESAAAQAPAAAAAAAGSKSPSKSWNPFEKKPTSPDEIKHVKVGSGVRGWFSGAEAMQQRAQKKVDEHIKQGGCAVVHNKKNGQY